MSGIAFVVKCKNILASLYVTLKRSHLTSAQSSVTGLYNVRHSPLILLTLDTMLSPTLSQDLPKHKIVVALEMMSTSDEKVHNLC